MASKKQSLERKAKKGKPSLGSPSSGEAAKSLSEPSRGQRVPDNFSVKNKSEYQGNDWWDWSVWIDGPKSMLNRVESVQYRLHPTYPQPVRTRTDARTKFRLDSSGWGEFMIGVEIKEKGGSLVKTQHWLSLDYPEQTTRSFSSSRSQSDDDERPTVFLSTSLADLEFATALGEALEDLDFEVVDSDDAVAGLPRDRAVTLLMKRADLFVAIVSGDLNSWAIHEIDLAINRNISIIPIVVGTASLPDSLKPFQSIALKGLTDTTKTASQIAQQISALVHE